MGITVGELYKEESKKRKRMAKKYKVFRFFGYNPMLMAFKRQCAFCLSDLSDDTVEGVWEETAWFERSKYMYTEEHQCSCCKQRWEYRRGTTRGKYKFDERVQKEYESFAWAREENKKRMESMFGKKQ